MLKENKLNTFLTTKNIDIYFLENILKFRIALRF